jgi:hypothetical protein
MLLTRFIRFTLALQETIQRRYSLRYLSIRPVAQSGVNGNPKHSVIRPNPYEPILL